MPPDRETLLRGVFPAGANAAGLTFPPDNDVFRPWRDALVVALAGGEGEAGEAGRVVALDPDRKASDDYVYNTRGERASDLEDAGLALERPVTVLRGPDGTLYVLDRGEVTMKRGEPRPVGRTGRLYRLMAPKLQTPLTDDAS